jgi:photosystem II stability/assembly factor-like uncharacterized protein
MSPRSVLPITDPVDLEAVASFSADPSFDDLFAQIVAHPHTSAIEPSVELESTADRHRLRLTSRQRHRLLAVAAAIVLLAAGLTVEAESQNHSNSRTTAWRAGRPVPSTQAPTHGATSSPDWQLVDDLQSSSWQQNTTGPPLGPIDCPSVSACYALSESYASPRGGAPLLGVSLYASADFGQSWSVLPVPTGFKPTTALFCGSAFHCAAGGLIGRAPAFLSTNNGGHQWTITTFGGGGILHTLDCSDASTCTGVSIPIADSRLAPTGGFATASAPWSLVHTVDGGQSWTSYVLPAGDRVTGLSCGTPKSCVVSGSDGAVSSALPLGFVMSTSDGGSHWRLGTEPSNFSFGGMSEISCATASNCMAIGLTSIPNPSPCGPPPEHNPPPGTNSCSTSPIALVTAVVVTNDGGSSWTTRTLPADVPNPSLSSLSCPSAKVCWLSGSEAVPIVISNVRDGGSSVLLGTSDGGETWQKVTFPVPAGAPNYYGQSYLSMGPISCPSIDACVATGAVAQGSKTTPIYDYHPSS